MPHLISRRAAKIATMTLAVTAALAGTSVASSTPVGPLPAGPTSTIRTQAGELIAVALPHRSGGRTWRVARQFDGRVVQQVSEADVGANVVVIFKALHSGKTTLAFALTKGESSMASESRTVTVLVD